MSIIHSYFGFMGGGQSLQEAMLVGYDPVLVIFSVMVVCVAAYTAFLFSERVYSDHCLWQRNLWWLNGVMVMGVGIWAMHFIGMMALRLSVAVYYDKFITLLSLFPAVLVSGIVLFVRHKQSSSRWYLPLLSVLMGVGIGMMQFISLVAMKVDVVLRYDPLMFSLSIMITLVLSYVSLRLKLWAESEDACGVPEIKTVLMAAFLIGSAISVMFYTSMASVQYFPLLGDVFDSHVLSVWNPDSISELLVYTVLVMLFLMIAAVHFTRRWMLLQQLQSSEIRQANIVNNMVDGLIVINEEGIIESFNPAAEKNFAYRACDVLGKNVNMLMERLDSLQHDHYMARYTESRMSHVIGHGRDVQGRRQDGSLFPVDIALSMFETDGKRLFSGVVRDITDRKQDEESVLEAKKIAEKSSQAKSEFLARVSHELRTPMNAIVGFGQLLDADRNDFSVEHQSYIRELQLASYRLLDLIDGMLELSQIETDKLDISMDTVLLNDVVTFCLGRIEPQARQSQIKIVNKISVTDYTVMADNHRLQQVLLHLLSNAIKYNRQEGCICLGTELKASHRLCIRITDTGPGLSEEQLRQLYTPFGRLNNDERLSGTGIGLAISKYLMEQMKGCIGVDTKPGIGSTFWIELDLATESGECSSD